MNIAIIEDSQPKTGLISKELEKYPYRKILAKFNIILKKTSKIYYEILRENPNKLNNEILTYMGFQNRKKNHQFSVSELENLAIQASHLILNKFFTYYVIKAQIHKNYGLKIGNLYDRSRNKEFQEQINEKFREIVETFEIAPIFQTEIFDNSIQFSEKLSNTLQEANNLFLELKIENLDDDIISNLYQMFIPFEEKKKLGQIYTPNEIADLMANLVIQNPNDVILDPACGCGTLLRSSYYRLKHLKKQRGIATDHKKLLSQIWGIEINAFPAQISMMSLAFMDLSEITQTAGIIMEDFLNIGPLKKYFVKSKNFMTGKIITRRMPGIFDVIIANPPYIKQELIPNKKKMMKNLPLFASYRKNSTKKKYSSISKNKTSKINLELTGKTDYYGFFLWYSTYFLKDHGKLCFIIPNKWMDVEYGQNLKKFILEKYKIIAIVGFNKNVFKNAQVSTVFLILQKERDKFKRNHHYVRFINILNKSGRIKLENLINTPLKSVFKAKIDWDDYIFKNNDPDLNCTYTRQDHLNISEKWSFKYLFQSKFSQILSKKSLISMDNHKITSIVGGIKTGANDFYFPSYENQEKFAIETQFLIPGIKTGRSIPTEYIINETKTKFLSVPAGINLIKYPGLRSYISYGSNIKKYHERRSVHWKPWFSIPPNKQDAPDIVFLRHINTNFKARWNKIKCVVADGIRGIKVYDQKHILFYLGICNSTYFYWQAHICGRWEGQGDLQLLVYELRRFLIPDIRKIPKVKIKKVEGCMKKIIENNQISKTKDKNTASFLQKDLDLAVLDTLGLINHYALLQKETGTLEKHRLLKKY